MNTKKTLIVKQTGAPQPATFQAGPQQDPAALIAKAPKGYGPAQSAKAPKRVPVTSKPADRPAYKRARGRAS